MEWMKNRFINFKSKKKVIHKYFDNIDNPIELWENDRVKNYQIDALKELVKNVYNNNEYYRAKLDKCGLTPDSEFSLDKFQNMEFTEKKELIQEKKLILSVPQEEISLIHLSTGTTGSECIYMMYTWDDLYVNDLAPEMPILVPSKTTDIVANALPYEMSSSGLSFHRVIQDSMQCAVIPVGKGGVYSEPKKTLKAIKDMNVNVLFTTPSYAMYLAQNAKEMGLKFGEDIKIDKMWITGEGCSNSFRNRIEEIWKCQALAYYGSLECGPIGIECPEKGGYHIAAGHVYVEIVDPETKKVLDPGEVGEVVVTTLLRDGMPLIRYKTQDLGYIEDIRCDCGVKLQTLYLRGRLVDQIKIDGKEYSPYYVEECLMQIPEVGNNYRFIVKEDHIIIETEIKDEFADGNKVDLEDMISSRVEFACGIPNVVRIVEKRVYDGKKAKRVIYE